MSHKILSIIVLAAAAIVSCSSQQEPRNTPKDPALCFDATKFTTGSITMHDGETVKFRAYEKIYYVKNVVDSNYQYLNFYVPETSTTSGKGTPILFRNSVGGYMAGPASQPNANDASGEALRRGYVVCMPGARGSNSKVGELYTGRAPWGLVDLKAAVRYLRYNDDVMPGDAELIFSDGTSAGGAMSSLLGATADHPDYDPYLEQIGAAPASDKIFGAICYCPIIDLDHADMAYEWLYKPTNDNIRALNESQKKVSEQLAAQFDAYIDGLGLANPSTGEKITSKNYSEYLKSWLIKSIQRARNEGADIPSGIGVEFNEDNPFGGMRPDRPKTDGRKPDGAIPDFANSKQLPGGFNGQDRHSGDFVIGLDLSKYVCYVAGTQSLKNPPAFDTKDVLQGSLPSAENKVFGDSTGSSVNFTDFSTAENGVELSSEVIKNVHLYNPMYYIGDSKSHTAPHWYIRHGARDRDISFTASLNLATKLANNGLDVNYALPWNRPHSGDYNLPDLFEWIGAVMDK